MKTWLAFGIVLVTMQVAQAACTPQQLKGLLLADADSIGVFILASQRRDDNQLVALVNQPRTGATQGGTSYLRSKGVVSRDQFLGSWADVIEGMQYIQDFAIKTKWEFRRDKLLIPKDTIDYDSPQITAFFGQMLSDGLMGANGPLTQTDVDARTKRPGSWAELRCGANLTLEDVTTALNLP